jgi:hypothetical protein
MANKNRRWWVFSRSFRKPLPFRVERAEPQLTGIRLVTEPYVWHARQNPYAGHVVIGYVGSSHAGRICWEREASAHGSPSARRPWPGREEPMGPGVARPLCRIAGTPIKCEPGVVLAGPSPSVKRTRCSRKCRSESPGSVCEMQGSLSGAALSGRKQTSKQGFSNGVRRKRGFSNGVRRKRFECDPALSEPVSTSIRASRHSDRTGKSPRDPPAHELGRLRNCGRREGQFEHSRQEIFTDSLSLNAPNSPIPQPIYCTSPGTACGEPVRRAETIDFQNLGKSYCRANCFQSSRSWARRSSWTAKMSQNWKIGSRKVEPPQVHFADGRYEVFRRRRRPRGQLLDGLGVWTPIRQGAGPLSENLEGGLGLQRE